MANAAKAKKSPKFRFLDHTADILMEAEGRDYAEALQNSALAMFSVLGKARAKEKFVIEEKATSLDELVVFALSSILSECDSLEFVPSKTKILEFEPSPPRIRMEVWGERKRARDAIKAVTFHELAVTQDKGGVWKIRVLFDV